MMTVNHHRSQRSKCSRGVPPFCAPPRLAIPRSCEEILMFDQRHQGLGRRPSLRRSLFREPQKDCPIPFEKGMSDKNQAVRDSEYFNRGRIDQATIYFTHLPASCLHGFSCQNSTRTDSTIDSRKRGFYLVVVIWIVATGINQVFCPISFLHAIVQPKGIASLYVNEVGLPLTNCLLPRLYSPSAAV